MPLTAADLIAAMEAIAPLRFACEWDNVGLLIGSRIWPAQRIMLTIDLTMDVLREAIDADAQAIVAYHPPIFHPLKRISDGHERERIVLEAVAARMSVYSPHTALDAASGGVNDWLIGAAGEGDVHALTPRRELPDNEQCKIITYCPADALDGIRQAMAAAGAGRIGNYEMCSFELRGAGTFLAGEGTNPAVGARGELNRVEEVRLEMVCSSDALVPALAALREFHPYEEPPIEIIRFEPLPLRSIGEGRHVALDQPVALDDLVARIKKQLNVQHLHVAEPSGQELRHHSCIGACAGAGGGLLDAALGAGCTAFLSGEMRHHDVLRAVAAGCTVMLAGHTNTERGYLPVLRQRLRAALPEATITISARDRDPLIIR